MPQNVSNRPGLQATGSESGLEHATGVDGSEYPSSALWELLYWYQSQEQSLESVTRHSGAGVMGFDERLEVVVSNTLGVAHELKVVVGEPCARG